MSEGKEEKGSDKKKDEKPEAEKPKEDLKNMDASKFTDLVINNLVVSKIGNVFDAGFELSGGNIAKLLVLMSTSELKTIVVSTISYVGNLLRISPAYAFNLIILLVSKLCRKEEAKIDQVQSTMVEQEDPRCKIAVNADMYFMIAFHKYLTQQTQCKFDVDLLNIDIKNSKENIFIRKYSNITIQLDNIPIQIEKPIVYGFNLDKGEVVEAYIDKHSMATKPTKTIEFFSDLLTEKQAEMIKNLYGDFLKARGPSVADCKKYLMGVFKDNTSRDSDQYLTEWIIIEKLLSVSYPQLKKDESFIELVLFSRIMYKFFNCSILEQIQATIGSTGRIMIDISNKYSKAFPHYSNRFCIGCEIRFHGPSNEGLIESNVKSTFIQYFGYKEQAKYVQEEEKEVKNDSFKLDIIIDISNPEEASKIDKNDVLERFVSSVNSFHKKTTTAIKIFTLKLEEEITEKEEENPEYTEWLEKKNLFEEIAEKKRAKQKKPECVTEEGTTTKLPKETLPITSSYYDDYEYSPPYSKGGYGYNSPYNAFMREKMPPKTIINQFFTKKVISTKLNEGEKNIDTLYLRQRDRKRIMCALTQFRDKKEKLKEMGLQNKLNILLHGPPGTGKSSTIQAVATFLQKDIYYVDLKKANSNDDLQLLINYVNINVPHGGLIVMEDIDAMSDVVLDRKNRMNKNTVSDLMDTQNSELSLEYLLNILQGTLTIDNSVFMITTNHLDHLDPAFYRPGRFDVVIPLGHCDHYQIACIYKKMMGRDIKQEILEKIKEDTLVPATVIFHIKNYMFDLDATDEEICEELIDQSERALQKVEETK